MFGVGASLSATLIVTFVVVFSKRNLLPWFKKQVYGGVDLTGSWYFEEKMSSGCIKKSTAQIQQKGADVACGVTMFQAHEGQEESIIEFKLFGKIQDGILQIGGFIPDDKKLGANSYLLKVVEGGSKLKGSKLWHSLSYNKVRSNKISWIRK